MIAGAPFSSIPATDVEGGVLLYPVTMNLHGAVVRALDSPNVKHRLEELGTVTISGTPAEFADRLRRETAQTRKAQGQ